MKNLSISVLRNFPIGNPNRGRDGSPKTTPFGGVRRSRISSQSQNYVIRQSIKEKLPEMVSLRTRLLPTLVEAAAKQYPNIAEESVAIKNKVKQLFGGKKDKEHTQILNLDPQDPDTFAAEISRFKTEDLVNYRNWLDPETIVGEMLQSALMKLGYDEDGVKPYLKNVKVLAENVKELADEDEEVLTIDFKNPSEEAVAYLASKIAEFDNDPTPERERLEKILKKRGSKKTDPKVRKIVDAAFWKRMEQKVGKISCQKLDVGLLGRMITEQAFDGVVGALTTSHAFSINEYREIVDDFTCIDDENKNGSGHLGEKQMHSSMFYTYYNINLDVLLNNVPELKNRETFEKVMQILVRTIYDAVPGGMLAKTGTRVPPEAILFEYNEKILLINNCNAYLAPIRPSSEDLTVTAVNRLANHVTAYNAEYPNTQRIWLCYNEKAKDFVATKGGKPVFVPNTVSVESVAEATEKLLQLIK